MREILFRKYLVLMLGEFVRLLTMGWVIVAASRGPAPAPILTAPARIMVTSHPPRHVPANM